MINTCTDLTGGCLQYIEGATDALFILSTTTAWLYKLEYIGEINDKHAHRLCRHDMAVYDRLEWQVREISRFGFNPTTVTIYSKRMQRL